jgi:hypothetical protein
MILFLKTVCIIHNSFPAIAVVYIQSYDSFVEHAVAQLVEELCHKSVRGWIHDEATEFIS